MSKALTLKSLEKLLLEVKAELKDMKSGRDEMKADLNNLKSGQKEIVNEMRELREEISTTKKKVLEVEKTVKFLNEDFEDMKKDNNDFKTQIEFVKKQNKQLSLAVEKIEDDGELSMKVNQIDNFLRRQNIEIQGIPATENENLEKIVTNVLKLVDPRIERKELVSFRRMKPSGMVNEKKKAFNPILVKFRSFEQKVKIMKGKKNLADANFSNVGKNVERVFINENLSAFSRDLLYHTRRFQKANEWRFSWSSGGNILLREKENSKAIVIRCVKDLENLQAQKAC